MGDTSSPPTSVPQNAPHAPTCHPAKVFSALLRLDASSIDPFRCAQRAFQNLSTSDSKKWEIHFYDVQKLSFLMMQFNTENMSDNVWFFSYYLEHGHKVFRGLDWEIEELYGEPSEDGSFTQQNNPKPVGDKIRRIAGWYQTIREMKIKVLGSLTERQAVTPNQFLDLDTKMTAFKRYAEDDSDKNEWRLEKAMESKSEERTFSGEKALEAIFRVAEEFNRYSPILKEYQNLLEL